ncbi:hypothetical protein [Pedobacter sp. Leaf176]|uniref:hypothetical protein n=1 Tax=Pedobacter sp. Leaf176 TaxID=1736286 RepID=UPI000A7E3366|nr:hypothetical protein [Pedobacter sp. Leaf176]
MGLNASSSRAARRQKMRYAGIPTSQQPSSQSANSSGRENTYDTIESWYAPGKKSVH